MKKYNSRLLLILSYFLISCGSENSNESTRIALDSPESNRQIMSLDIIRWRALIRVNGGPAQNFYFDSSTSPMSAIIGGVNRGRENEISIKWHEILNRHTVEISQQDQKFTADGATIIDAEHVNAQFDYDDDGESNLAERSAGTCVWSATEICVNDGQTDIPTGNMLLDGDFSNPTTYWSPDINEVLETSGEYCLNSPATAVNSWDTRISYSTLPIFIDANSNYNIAFDVRAQTNSEAFVQMAEKTVDDTFEELMLEPFEVSTTYERKSIRYENADDAINEVVFGFHLGNGKDNTYCFDNITLIREATQ